MKVSRTKISLMLLAFYTVLVWTMAFHLFSTVDQAMSPIKTEVYNDNHFTNHGQYLGRQLQVAIVNPTPNASEDTNSSSDWMNEPIVNPFLFTFVHNPKTICLNRKVEVVIAVPLARSKSTERQTIRATWGTYARNPSNKAVLLFFLGSDSGQDNSRPHQKSIDMEWARHGDIVQADYVDSYGNLSLKSMSILRWVDAHCHHTDFLVKADDDVYVVLPNLMAMLRRTRAKMGGLPFILGRKKVGSKPMRANHSKWYMPEAEFPQERYPPFSAGSSYSMSGRAVSLLYQAALRTPRLWLEDVYLTGLCARKAGVALVFNPLQTLAKYQATGCAYRKVTVGHHVTPKEMRTIYNQLMDKNLTCPIQDTRKRRF